MEDKTQYDLILSDDLDSLASCMVLKYIKDWDIQYFYRFDGMGKAKSATNEAVGVDIALCKGKTFDNHVTKLHKDDAMNPESINLNCMADICRDNYFTKYCGSTLLTIWSLFDLPIPESDEGKMILLCIDSTYLGFYSGYPNDRNANKHYLCDVLGLDELYDFQKDHKQMEYKAINKKYNLDAKIKSSKGILSTDIDLDAVSKEIGIPLILPDKNFYWHKKFSNNKTPIYDNRKNTTKLKDIVENPFSVAVTGRDFFNYSVEVERKK